MLISTEEIIEQDAPSAFDFFRAMALLLWKEWPQDMEAYSLPNPPAWAMRGTCPYPSCKRDSVFLQVAIHSSAQTGYVQSFVAIMQCQGCLNFILAKADRHAQTGQVIYKEHVPLGAPDDNLSTDIPPEVRAEFKEALQCDWIKAHKATVLMCRRALQVSCDREDAAGDDLYTQIDDLAKKQKITKPLQEMAHRIRLLGKKGAHGDFSDIDDTITPQDAEEGIKFMRHYLDHVYVFPAMLAPPKPQAATGTVK
jgi:hypothetical protein